MELTILTLGRSWHCWISAGPDNSPHSATTKLPAQRTNCSSHFNPHNIRHNIMNILASSRACLSKQKMGRILHFPCFRSGYCSLCCLSMLLVRWRMTSCLQSRDSSTKYTSGNMKMSGTALSLNFSTIIYRLNTPLTRCRVPHFPRITKYQMSKEYF